MYVDCVVCYVLLCCYRFLEKKGGKREKLEIKNIYIKEENRGK